VTESPSDGGRYSALRLFVLAVAFIAAAPAFWHRTQIHPDALEAAYENADLYQEVYPSFHYGFGRLRQGEIPLWNANQLCGAPFQANPAAGIFQPLNAVFVLLPTEQAMAVHAFLCLALMGIFFALFARALGVGYVAALLGGTAYAFCGASAAAVSMPALATALAWTPFLFWTLRECANGFRLSGAIRVGVAAALLALSGANALVLVVLCVAVLYGLLLALYPRGTAQPDLGRRFECLVLAAAIAAAVSAVQWIPALMWVRALDRPLETLWALDLPGQVPVSVREMLAQLLVPKPSALPRIGYLGGIALLAVPAAAFHPEGRRDAVFFAAAAVMLFLASVGGLGRLPGLFPQGFCALPGMFGLAVLAALGFDRLLMSGRGSDARRAWGPALVVLTAAVVLFYASTVEPRGRIVVFVLFLLPVVVLHAPRVSSLCGVVVALLLFADLTSASANRYRHPFQDAAVCYSRYAKTIATAEEQALGARVLVSPFALDFGLPVNIGMVFPVLCGADGQAPLTRDQTVWWRSLGPAKPASAEGLKQASGVAPDAPAPRLINFMAARVVLAAPGSPLYSGAWTREGPRLREIRTEDNLRLFVNEDALPRAFLTPSWRVADGVAAAVDLLGNPAFDATRECVIDRDSEGYDRIAEVVPGPRNPDAESLPAPPDATCTVEDFSAERVTVRVGASGPGITVLADTFDPAWDATLDGMPCPVLRTNAVFRGVATPQGSHRIVFDYRPLSFTLGMTISLVTIGLLVIGGVIGFVRA
jgi:hypothetical protein